MGTVLVVEDSAPAREVVMRILRREGYTVIGASDGVEAWDSVHTTIPDLVLLDLMMPGMDGITLLTKLRKEPGLKDLPVIMLSALSDESRIKRAKELGAQDYLVKTCFTYDDLLKRVEQHVRH
jgi:CheY-like chemotaxis protein